MPIEFTTGDMFSAQVDARVNAVNCVGVAGKGLAKTFADRYPAMLRWYQDDCRRGLYSPGMVVPWVGDDTVVFNACTKDHWRDPSRLEWVAACLRNLREWLDADAMDSAPITSVAVPALGCGLGGLDWRRVRPMVADALGTWPGRALVYEP